MQRWKHLGPFILSIFLAIAAVKADARPYRGGIPWAVLLCKFSDSPTPPHDLNYYKDMILNSGTQGLEDYVKAVSYGLSDMTGSNIHGWYTIQQTTAHEQNLANRGQKWQDCIDAAKNAPTNAFTPASGQKIYVITSPGIDLYGLENVGAFGGDDVALPEIAHEFGHGIGLEHSWSNDVTWHDATWSGGGEYDNPWDLMSAANIFVDPTGKFQGGPPDLDAHHLDEMGWLPKSRILTLGVDGILSRTVTLAALTHPEASGYLEVRIPFDAKDRFHYYTVEFRNADSWDSGIPGSIVMINEINNNSSYYQTTLQRTLGASAGTGNGAPVQTLNANGVTISVTSTAGHQATVQVSTQFALPCAQGFVWREASSIDRVCVTGATRTETAQDNAAAASRHVANSATCKQGFVWREAFPGDQVCVTSATRSQAAQDDANAYAHVNESLVSYGPNTCQNGFVWRDGDDSDYVCVSPSTRTQAAEDNAAAGSRHVSGSDTCKQGFVWREAWPGDHVCVTGATRTQAAQDNAAAGQRLWNGNASIENPLRDSPLIFKFMNVAQASDEKMPEPETPAPLSEAVLRVRLQKMGYTKISKLKMNGDYWEATVSKKKGKSTTIRIHAQSGAVAPAKP